ncbi:hypothetical protein cypCar_00040367 [Cyprinus carpio]|nr:hypothetical protein cypCar_00040367 [Cyprinus carpio]
MKETNTEYILLNVTFPHDNFALSSPAFMRGPDAAAGEDTCWTARDLHGVINAPRLVERVHGRGRDEAVPCQSGQRTGEAWGFFAHCLTFSCFLTHPPHLGIGAQGRIA